MKRENDIVALIMADIGSPAVVASIDKALADNEAEREELLDLRKMAVRRHGEPSGDAPPRHDNPTDLALTVKQLVESYRDDGRSGFHEVRHATRLNYISLLRRIENDIGDEKVADLNTSRLQELFDEWSHGGHAITAARGRIAMLRVLASFGSTVLESRDCRELKLTLHEMRFEKPAPPSEDRRLKPIQVKQIIARANEVGMHSIALAQALQIECGLKQKDLIGEYLPQSDPAPGIIFGDEKWARGIVWEEITPDSSANFLLRHVTSWTNKEMEFLLTSETTPLVVSQLIAQIARVSDRTGPLIINENTGRPFLAHQFRREWRKIADDVGVPKNVMNRDSS
jgi:hypothetical protein